MTRPYSIASPPEQQDRILLVLNRAGGPGSSYLFSLREGSERRSRDQLGAFYLRDDGTKDLLFVATGTGIAPMQV